MNTRRSMTMALGLFVATAAPAIDESSLQRPTSLTELDRTTDSNVTVGSVGMDSHAGDSRRHEYFNIPSERSARTAPGIIFKIPLGN